MLYWKEVPPAHVTLSALLRALTSTDESASDGPTMMTPLGGSLPDVVRPQSPEELEAALAYMRG